MWFMSDKNVWTVAFLCVIAFVVLVIFFSIKDKLDYDDYKEKCEQIDGCDRYECLANISNKFDRVSYLTQKTNCLLEQQMCGD